jgi:hypothetical protein
MGLQYILRSILCNTHGALAGDSEYRNQAICLRATAQYQVGNVAESLKGLVDILRHHPHESIVSCLKSIALDEFGNSKSERIGNLKEIIGVALRGEGVIPEPVRQRR